MIRTPHLCEPGSEASRTLKLYQNLMRQASIDKVVCKVLENQASLCEIDLLKSVFQFLAFFCKGNHDNQVALSNISRLIFEGKGFQGTMVSFTTIPRYFGRMLGEQTLLKALYHNNYVVARAISEQAISQIVTDCQSNVQNHDVKVKFKDTSRYLALLEQLITVDRAPIQQNQNMVMHEILSHTGLPILDRHFWLEEQSNGSWAVTAKTIGYVLQAERVGMLDDPGELTTTRSGFRVQKGTNRLHHAIQAMHMVAACADGPNEQAARQLRSVYSLRALADILCSSVNAQMKRATIHMIDAIYITPMRIDSSLVKDLFLVDTATHIVHNHAAIKALVDIYAACISVYEVTSSPLTNGRPSTKIGILLQGLASDGTPSEPARATLPIAFEGGL